MTDQISTGMRCYIASRREMEDNGYPLHEPGYIRLSGKSEIPEVFAIDCEMRTGVRPTGVHVQEVVKISIVNHRRNVVWDKVVRPRHQGSGFSTAGTVSLNDVHNYFRSNFKSNTIFVGHSLESDLRALNLIHDSVVDVSLVYPRTPQGEKYSLKDLAKIYLNRDIQMKKSHESAEDAIAALDLLIHHIKELRVRK